jgi:hypothetical protein
MWKRRPIGAKDGRYLFIGAIVAIKLSPSINPTLVIAR